MINEPFVIANNLPYGGEPAVFDPKRALADTIVFSSDDWWQSRAMAWVYGIVVGWDDDDPMEGETGREALDDLAAKFGWSDNVVTRLRELHRRFEAL